MLRRSRTVGRRSGGVVEASTGATGSWGTPVVLSETEEVEADPPAIAVAAGGEVVAAWEHAAEEEKPFVQSAAKPVAGAWTAPVQISPAGSVAQAPRLAVDGEGDALATWFRCVRRHRAP